MVYSNSSSDYNSSDSKQSNLKKFKRLLVRFFRGIKRFIDAKTLPLFLNKTCEIYFEKDNKTHQGKCRHILQTRLKLNPIQLYRFFHTSMGDTLLSWFERFFHLPNHHQKKQALKELLVEMANKPEGLSLLSFLNQFPDTIQVNMDQLLLTLKQIELFLKETDITIENIQKLSSTESEVSPRQDFANLPDLRNFGEFKVRQYNLEFKKKREESLGVDPHIGKIEVTCYQPQPWPNKAVPVIVQSHGLASSPKEMEIYARHLASYGYFVVAPRHLGSDVKQLQKMLEGKASEVFQLSEFIQRPLNISYLLDQLEQDNIQKFAGKLNLNSVGIMGFSFGAYTGFALAGAKIHFDKLEMACEPLSEDPNVSLLLQCQALRLPRQVYNFEDKRIQAILSVDSFGSEIFGEFGIEKIKIPVMLVAGSHDLAASLIFEQIRLFQWLSTSDQYFVLMQGKSHVRDLQNLINSVNLELKISPPKKTVSKQVRPFEQYIKALSIAFFDLHLMKNRKAEPYLSANYADFLSEDPYKVWLIS